MSECIFCKADTDEMLFTLSVCDNCKFLHQILTSMGEAPTTVLFCCKNCDYKGDVAGVMETTLDDDGVPHTVTKVDSTHKFCQQCGASSRGVSANA